MGIGPEYSTHFAGTHIETTRSPISGLKRELQHVRSNWQSEGLKEDWRLLEGTGFWVTPHIDMLYDSFTEIDTYSSKREKIATWLQETKEDIKGFNLEYLAEGLTFPIFYKILTEENRMICPLYGDKDVSEIVSEEERNGSVKRAMVDKVTPFLLDAEDGSIAVMTSPSGWSGLKTPRGVPITFPDSQTYIWQKKGDEVVGFTIRTDFTLDEHREVIKRLTGVELSADADVCDFVESVSFLRGEENPDIGIGDIVNLMRFTRQDLSGGKKLNAYEDRQWNEIYKDLLNSNLWKFDDKEEEYISELEEFVEGGDWARRELEEALALTVLRMAKYLGNNDITSSLVSHDTSYDPRSDDGTSYGQVFKEVEEKAGCAGGGGKGTLLERLLNPTKFILSSISPRLAEAEDEGFTCPKCLKGAVGPIGDKCPNCSITKQEFARMTGGEVCD